MKINHHYQNVEKSYLFSTIASKVAAYKAANPDQKVIPMGIGDVTRPLAPAVVGAMVQAAKEQGIKETFRGYGPEQGYPFLREKVKAYYEERSIAIAMEEIFICDGAKSDIGNIVDIFDDSNHILVPNPVYPVYVDTNTMSGRNISYMNATMEQGFVPLPQEGQNADIIYICSPNNPTGSVMNRDQLQAWVDFANRQGAVILFDAAYEVFVQDASLPRSIFEMEGARTCAIEFCSLSKTAGFTGTRCGYTIVPKELISDGVSLRDLWLRRQTTKFNGVSYVVQRGAEAVFSPEGRAQIQESIAYYRKNARVMAETMQELGLRYTGGIDSPYIWFECPCGMDDWDFFDRMLEEIHVVGTPGSGFGSNGKGYFRLTAFGDADDTVEAMKRFRNLIRQITK